MKTLLTLLLLTATPALAGPLPEKVVCDEGKFIAGLQEHSDPTFYFPRTIRPLTDVRTNNWSTKTHGEHTFITKISGEQFEIYRFKTTELDAFVAGSQEKLTGTFEAGYEWDKYYLDARFATTCHR